MGIGRTGAVQISLTWQTTADLDLHLIDASGEEIYYRNKESTSGGMLDVDRIPGSGDTGPHIENIFWDSPAPPGRYTASVVNYASAGNSSSSYEMAIYVGGRFVERQTGTLVSTGESGGERATGRLRRGPVASDRRVSARAER